MKVDKKWFYSYRSLAKLLGMNVEQIKKLAKRGNFNPNCLLSVAKFIIRNWLKENKPPQEQSPG